MSFARTNRQIIRSFMDDLGGNRCRDPLVTGSNRAPLTLAESPAVWGLGCAEPRQPKPPRRRPKTGQANPIIGPGVRRAASDLSQIYEVWSQPGWHASCTES